VPFDLLHWNGDVTNLPAKWHLSYLTDLYRDNLLVKPGAMAVAGVPLDLSRVTTPAYIQAGREDHIAPPESVWKITDAFAALALRARRVGAYRGRGQPAGGGQISILDQRPARRDARRVRRGGPRDQGELVAGLGRMAARTRLGNGRCDRRAHTRRGPLPALDDAPGRYVRQR
jgi:polyhydroxyalkanoate synthase